MRSKIRIREPVPNDAAFFAALENDVEVKRFIGGPSRKSEADYRKSIEEMPKDCRCLTVISQPDEKAIGRCGVIVNATTAEIHLVLAKEYWRKGLGTEVALELLRVSSNRFPDKRLSAKVHPSNKASHSILKKIGMIEVGTVTSIGYDNGFLTFEKPALN